MLTKQEFAEGVRGIVLRRIAGREEEPWVKAAPITFAVDTHNYGATSPDEGFAVCLANRPDMSNRRRVAYALIHELAHVMDHVPGYCVNPIMMMFDPDYADNVTHGPNWKGIMHYLGLVPFVRGKIEKTDNPACWLDPTLWPEIDALGPVEGLE